MSDDKVYSINESAKQRTHIDNETYLAMYDASINDPETFWKSQSDAFLQWDTPWTKLQQTDFAQGQA
ncbi:MAG: acetyl-coenzyme A synthetase N-terminal domain-containing protein, partial [Pseudomonadales bacterium]